MEILKECVEINKTEIGYLGKKSTKAKVGSLANNLARVLKEREN